MSEPGEAPDTGAGLSTHADQAILDAGGLGRLVGVLIERG